MGRTYTWSLRFARGSHARSRRPPRGILHRPWSLLPNDLFRPAPSHPLLREAGVEGRVARRQGTQPLCGGVQGACAEGEGAAATPTGSGGVFALGDLTLPPIVRPVAYHSSLRRNPPVTPVGTAQNIPAHSSTQPSDSRSLSSRGAQE